MSYNCRPICVDSLECFFFMMPSVIVVVNLALGVMIVRAPVRIFLNGHIPSLSECYIYVFRMESRIFVLSEFSSVWSNLDPLLRLADLIGFNCSKSRSNI